MEFKKVTPGETVPETADRALNRIKEKAHAAEAVQQVI